MFLPTIEDIADVLHKVVQLGVDNKFLQGWAG